MINRANTTIRSWRQIAAEVAQENDPRKRNELTTELLQAVEREKCQAEAQSVGQEAQIQRRRLNS